MDFLKGKLNQIQKEEKEEKEEKEGKGLQEDQQQMEIEIRKTEYML